MPHFTYEQDRAYFEQLLCEPDETIEDYADLFDLDRSPNAKRFEFARLSGRRLQELRELLGDVCQLTYAPGCDPRSGLVVDHLIPLSSNKLNKESRHIPTSRQDGKLREAPTQSFGSNQPRNLVLACTSCNSLKQNRFLERQKLRSVLQSLADAGIDSLTRNTARTWTSS